MVSRHIGRKEAHQKHPHLDQILGSETKKHLTIYSIFGEDVSQLRKSNVVEPKHYLVQVHFVGWLDQTTFVISFNASKETSQTLNSYLISIIFIKFYMKFCIPFDAYGSECQFPLKFFIKYGKFIQGNK